MKWFNNMKISAKLISAFIVVALIAGIVGAIGIVNLKQIEQSDTELYENMTVPIAQMSEISTSFQRIRVNLRDMVIADDQAEIESKITKIQEYSSKIQDNSDEFEKLIVSDEMRKAFEDFIEKSAEATRQTSIVQNLARENKDDEAFALIAETGAMGVASREEQNSIEVITKMKLEDAKAKSDLNTEKANSSILIMVCAVAFGILLAVGIGIYISRIISKPINQLKDASDLLAVGDINVDVKSTTKDEIGMLMKSFEGITQNIKEQSKVAEMISQGDFSMQITPKSDNDVLAKSMKSMVLIMNNITGETSKLIQATKNGQLDTRGDEKAFTGGWSELIGGINEMVDAFVGPINVTAEYVERISKGDIPAKITDNYNGDFNEIKRNLNRCIDIMNGLLDESSKLIQATKNGQLDTRGDEKAFTGGWSELIGGINEMVDAFVGPINVTADYVERISKGDIPAKITDNYNGDFNAIKNNLNTCIDAINALVTDANMLVEAAVNGKLSERANASLHGGDFRKIVEGVNQTLDAVVKPVQEAAGVLKEMSEGNLQLRVTGDYKGDHADIKNALNDTLDSLASYVDEIAYVLNQMANSNLDLVISNEYKGDFSEIKSSLNLIIDAFNNVLSDVNNATLQVASGSRQVSDSAMALSQGTTEQASSIEELTASIEEIATQTRNNADKANQAKTIAGTAKNDAEQGNEQMKQMLTAMFEINESSNSISKIIKVIDDIAFQTNILALNAAVEAARAGKHGKGFAVVAEEVRNLAARSANAAKETTDMIEGSIQKVNDGTKIANSTADALGNIVHGVSQAADLVSDIAIASNEQAIGVEQINQGIMQISEVVQTTSAISEESAAASEELSSQADLLKTQVSRFKLKKNISGGGSSELTPEMEKMLSGLSEKNKKAKPTKKIKLSDNEFGKY